MRSPFLGMDPYIETSKLWGDFHDKLIAEIARDLAARLPKGYFLDLNRRSYVVLVEPEGKETHPFVPDVKVISPQAGAAGATTATMTREPATEEVEVMTMELVVTDEFRETFVEIFGLDNGDEILVTSIEVLSPSNKLRDHEGWRQYLRKRQSLVENKTNLVELDLLRGGSRFPMRSSWPDSPYTLLVCRGTSAPRCQVRRGHYRTRLPIIPIPLRPGHADISLDLQAMVDVVYQRSRYSERFDYNKPLVPPLSPDDATWFAETLQAWNKEKQSEA